MVQKAITRIHIEGFRSLNNVDLEPGRVTVLIGANGSGKSNLLSFLRMICLARTKSLRRFVGEAGGASSLLHYGPSVTREIAFRVEFSQDVGTNAYAARLGYAAGDSLLFLDETVAFQPPGAKDFSTFSLGAGHTESRLDDESEKAEAHTAKAVRWLLSRTSFYHFHDTSITSPMRQNARAADDRYLRSDGSNLAAFLHRLAESAVEADRAAWKRITMLVKQVAPYIKRLEPEFVDPGQSETSAIRLRWVDERDHRFDVHDLSDGTLRAIALITALNQPAEHLPRFISIDEPELGLHPAAIQLLVALVRSISQRSQVLLATQSPYLLDQFDPDEIVVAERPGGATNLKRFTNEQLASWLEEYTLSELYDKNLLGGRP